MQSSTLVGVIHLPALPACPRNTLSIDAIVEGAVHEAKLLADAGYHALIVENFGDVPFFPDHVPPITVSCMTAAVRAVREAVAIEVGVNVLRNDPSAALAIAAASSAHFIRVNVHSGTKVTDQGIVQTAAHITMRERSAMRADHIRLLCDVDVKHAAPLGERNIGDEAEDLVERAMCDVVLVTGAGTGKAVNTAHLDLVRQRVDVPIFAASGVTVESLAETLAHCNGVIVGSALRQNGKAGTPLDPARVHAFAKRFAECTARS